MISQLFLCDDPISAAKIHKNSTQNTKIFTGDEKNELKIEHAHEIIRTAHVAHHEGTQILIAALFFNDFAQNALLKILEDPPLGVRFFLFAKNKNALLPTVLSRVTVTDSRTFARPTDFPLDVSKMTLSQILKFLQNLKRNNNVRDENSALLNSLLNALKNSEISLNDCELTAFSRAFLANFSHHRSEMILAPLLLMILRKRG